MKKLFIIDGHALCYRAYYAFIRNPLTNSRGQNTSAIFGFARMLFRLIQDQAPDYLAVAFDPPEKSFRFRVYPEYKANREKMPDDLRTQVEEIKRMVELLGIQRLEVEDYEADDILGSMAEQYASDDLEVYLVTGDKDAYQLVGDHVKVLANKKGISDYEIYDNAGIKEKLGITPEQVIDYMAITGDTSDNIPGVKGIGEKGARKLIETFGSFEEIYKRIDEVKGKQKELLEQGREEAELSRELVTIKTDVQIPVELDDMAFTELPPVKSSEFFREHEMDSIIRDFFGSSEGSPAPTVEKDRDYRTVTTEKGLEELTAAIQKVSLVSIDTETTSLSPVDAELVGISFSVTEREGWYVPVRHGSLFSGDILDRGLIFEKLGSLLNDPNILKIGQNIKYDLLVLRGAGIELAGVHFDTMVASYLLDPNERRHNLDDLAERYLNYSTIKFKDLTGTGKRAVPLEEVELEKLAEYAIEDADITLRLYNIFSPRLKQEDLEDLFYDVEMPLVAVLADMEYTGVKLDTGYMKELLAENERRLEEVEKQIYGDAGQTFNINSTRELSTVLFEKLALKPQKKTKTGYSTDITVLEALRGSHDIIDRLIAYRTLSKLKNTYVETLPTLISTKTGRIHTSYNQTVAATGRLSSSDPNLQNIPIRDEFGKSIRRGFVPEKGYVLMAADYSQIELRLAAHLSGDGNMIRAFTEGTDIHNLTASSVFGVALDQVESEMRRQAKIINFATIYGVSPYGLSQQADISVKDASLFIERYFETYPGVRAYVDETIAFAREHGYVKTLLGRKRAVLGINSDDKFPREGAERIAINTPIQGTSADMIKVAMINIAADLSEHKMKSKMILQVHDELVFEVHESERDEIQSLVKDRMENALDLDVPIQVGIGWGDNWEEAH